MKLKALYTSAGDPSSNTPALVKDEILTLLKRHDSGWLEIETAVGVKGYISPAWCVEVDEPEEAVCGNDNELDLSELPPPPVDNMYPTTTDSGHVIDPADASVNESGDWGWDLDASAAAAAVFEAGNAAPLAHEVSMTEGLHANDASAETSAVNPPPSSRGDRSSVPDPVQNGDLSAEADSVGRGVGGSPTVKEGLVVPEGRTYSRGPAVPAPEPPVRKIAPDVPVRQDADVAASPGSGMTRRTVPGKVGGAFADQLAGMIGGGLRLPPHKPAVLQHEKQTNNDEAQAVATSSDTSASETRPLAAASKPSRAAPPPPPIRASSLDEISTTSSAAPARAPPSKPPRNPAPVAPSRGPPSTVPPVQAFHGDLIPAVGGPAVTPSGLPPIHMPNTKPPLSPTPPSGTHGLLPPPDKANIQLPNRSGSINKKVLLEDGKENSKRSWAQFFLVLNGDVAFFYKDEKASRGGKLPLSVFPLGDKSLIHAHDFTKKKFSLALGNDTDRICLQAASEDDFSGWISALVPRTRASGGTGTNFASFSNDEEIRRSTTLGKEKGWNMGIKKALNKALRSRPKKEELEERGILSTEPVFGGTIAFRVSSEATAHPDDPTIVPDIPIVVVKCIRYVDRYPDEHGIYRVSGNASTIQKLSLSCNEDSFGCDVDAVNDVHTVGGLLKFYFRELKDPLFTNALYPRFIAAVKDFRNDRESRLERIKELLQLLPRSHQATLQYLCKHLSRISKHAEVNMMHTKNIALVFGPTLCRLSEPSLESIVQDSPFQSGLVEDVLIYHDWMLGGSDE